MNKLLDLQLNVWKLTGTINRLQAVETRSTDEDTELTTATAAYADVNGQLVAEGEREHTRIEAARLAHPTDPAVRELRELVRLANLGDVHTAVLEHRTPDGATLEAQQAYGLGPKQWPVDGLRLEARAVTPSIANVATGRGGGRAPRVCNRGGRVFWRRSSYRPHGRCGLSGPHDAGDRGRSA